MGDADMYTMSPRLVLAALLAASTTHAAVESPHDPMKEACETCHASTSFKDVEYDHGRTDFALEGRHATVACKSCHDIKSFAKAESRCASCHLDVHEARLGADCARCHNAASWSVFDLDEIHTSTRYPVMGRHAQVDCQSCHPTMPQGDMVSQTTRCVECHQPDYLAVTSPNHVSAGFSTECQDCHQMNFWRPANMGDHDAIFPIFSGTHAGQWPECGTCHIDPSNSRNFSCLSCHEHDQTPMDARHQGMPGYAWESHACYTCHPTGVAGQFLEHDAQFFPVYSGKHAGTWNDCSQCHDNPANRAAFNCLTCHEQAQMDPTHVGFPGYTWESNACLNCHPTGQKGQFIQHDATYFPIYSGNHAGSWVDCTVCHSNPVQRSQFTCLTCHEHEQPLMDPVHVGMPGYAWESQTCLGCHPSGLKGQFTQHDALYFPIYTSHHAGTWADCNVCHANPATRAEFSCLTCHEHDQALMDPVHQGFTGYAWQSDNCYSCHPTGAAGQFTQHDAQYFSIFSGRHAGLWNSCADCHTQPAQRSFFTCFEGCHFHTADRTNGQHTSVNGYAYDSQTCLTCHPSGNN